MSAYVEHEFKDTHLRLHVLRVVLPVDLARRCLTFYPKGCIPDLSRQPVLQVKQTRLANILDLRTGLADDSGLVSHAGARVPAEDGEGARASAAGATEFLF